MPRGRLLAVGLGAGLASLLGWQVLRSSSVLPRPWSRKLDELVMDEALARKFWGEKAGYRFDPVAYLVKLPDRRSTWPWAEYPGGEIAFATNEQGFREDQPTPREFAGPRIVVAGDSHTDGTVANEESFANVAEALLRKELAREIDVVNAGVGFTGPSCYLGMLKKCLELRPDVFVTVLYAGNDFLDELTLAYALRRRTPHALPPEYLLRGKEVADTFLGFPQNLNQAYRFEYFPGEDETALALVLDVVFAIDAECRANGIDFLLVVLPSKPTVEEDDREAWLEACRRLELDERVATPDLELGRRVLAAAAEHGIACLDPLAALRLASVPLYWKKDYHLALAGHALLGALLAERLREILAERASRVSR